MSYYIRIKLGTEQERLEKLTNKSKDDQSRKINKHFKFPKKKKKKKIVRQ